SARPQNIAQVFRWRAARTNKPPAASNTKAASANHFSPAGAPVAGSRWLGPDLAAEPAVVLPVAAGSVGNSPPSSRSTSNLAKRGATLALFPDVAVMGKS